MKPQVGLLITDLDNTLYDWVTFFATAFYEMVTVAEGLIRVPRETLLDDLQRVHRSHHNSEQPFALLETDAVRSRLSGLSRKERAALLEDAFRAFNAARDRTLRVYPGVREALSAVRKLGCPIVGHTEASAANAEFRLGFLGLSPFFSALYAVENLGAGHPNPERARRFQRVSRVRYLRHDERKPDPQVLLDICSENGVPTERCLYVGDSIARDIGMAKEAGVWAAWAEYGTRYDRRDWDRLVRITHWTDDDVSRARMAQERYGSTPPDVTLRHSFAEILDHFTFHLPEEELARGPVLCPQRPDLGKV